MLSKGFQQDESEVHWLHQDLNQNGVLYETSKAGSTYENIHVEDIFPNPTI